MALICSKCGAEFDAPARFCRRCGNSLGVGEPSISPSEATTKSFDYPVDGGRAGENQTAPANRWPTAPAYLRPDQMTVAPQYPAHYPMPPGAETRGLGKKRNALLVLGIVLFVLLVLVPSLAFLMYEVVHQDSPPVYSAPSADSGQAPGVPDQAGIPGPPPNVPGHPPIPPAPPGAPAPPDGLNGTVPPMLASLIYPGSRQSVNVHSQKEGTMILSSTDPSSKVVDWYVAKLPNAQVVSIPFVGGGVITKGQVSVTVTPGSPTTIILAIDKSGKD